jgi:4-amino-4-deoxy-L-arabinose transferase-like glycosyltransferase
MISFLKKHFEVLALLLLNILMKGWNLFEYPFYNEDEGTYVSQATALIYHGKLAFYTYWYDHAPFGWLIISIWQRFIRLFNLEFATYIDETRVLMVIISTYILWCLIQLLKKFEINQNIILVMSLLYVYSPIVIYYHRSIFLDNIMMSLVMSSLLLMIGTKQGWRLLLSGLVFGLAVLTKETAIFFFPYLLIVIFKNTTKENRNFILTLWLAIVGVTIFEYATFAIIKGEFLPSNFPIFANKDRVSMIDTLLFQNNRSDFFWDENSTFRTSLRTSWLRLDPILVFFGTASVFLNLFNKHSRQNFLGWMLGAGYIFYLLKWQALDFYIIPLLPIFIISISIFLQSNLKPKGVSFVTTFSVMIIIISTGFNLRRNQNIFYTSLTDSQREVINWAKINVDEDEFVVIDNYAFMDLNKPTGSIYDFQYHYFWKVEKDPEIRNGMLNNETKNISYVFMTGAMESELRELDFPFLNSYINEATLIKTIGDEYQVKIYSTNETIIAQNK